MWYDIRQPGFLLMIEYIAAMINGPHNPLGCDHHHLALLCFTPAVTATLFGATVDVDPATL